MALRRTMAPGGPMVRTMRSGNLRPPRLVREAVDDADCELPTPAFGKDGCLVPERCDRPSVDSDVAGRPPPPPSPPLPPLRRALSSARRPDDADCRWLMPLVGVRTIHTSAASYVGVWCVAATTTSRVARAASFALHALRSDLSVSLGI